MDPIKTYDYLSKSRRIVLSAARPLAPEQWGSRFDFGLGSIARTFTHIMNSERYYMLRMTAAEIPPYDTWDPHEDRPPSLAVLEGAWERQMPEIRAAILSMKDWRTPLEYRVTDEQGKRMVVRASPMDQFTQLVIHEAHHRSQALHMLRRCGVWDSRDIDFNALMFERCEEHASH